MKIIGITGGVGSGKSRVLEYLAKRSETVICQADQVAWQLQQPGETCYDRIKNFFGTDILSEEQTIDRRRLGAIVFADGEKLAILNRIMHPAVKERVKKMIAKAEEKGCDLFVLEAALLIEDHYDAICDELWYIYADRQVRTDRLKKSRGYTDEKIRRIMQAQIDEEQYKAGCDRVIDNSGDFAYTCRQVDKALEGDG